MFGSGPLLVASDGSAAAEAALRAAQRLAANGAFAGVRVITVVEPLAIGGPGPEITAIDARMDEDRRRYLHDLIAEQVERVSAGAAWTVDAVWGHPAHAIAAAALQHDAALLLMGLTHHSRVYRMLGGETALSVIRQSSVPVLLVPADAQESPRVAVVGVDFSRGSVLAASAAVELLGAGGGTLHLVHARPGVAMTHDRWEAWDVACTAGVPTLLDDVRATLGATPGVRVECVQLRGDARSGLLAFADQVGAGVLALAPHRHGMLERLLAGSTTDALVRAANCSVLVVPPGSDGHRLGVPYADSVESGSVK